MPADPDDTIVLARPPRRRRWPWTALGVAACLAAGAGGVAAWQAAGKPGLPVRAVPLLASPPPASAAAALPPPAPTLPPAPQPSTPRPAALPESRSLAATQPPPTPILAAATLAEPPRLVLPHLATEAEILAQDSPGLVASRFAPAPDIFVLRFANLAEQADMLNRIAALVERAGYPRDRVLPAGELDRRIRAAGDTPERVYLGHDYRSTDVLRFFALTDHERIALTPGEARLHRLVAEWGWTADTRAALITLPREDRAAGLDPSARATILRHELSHGLYFTDRSYAGYVEAFWSGTLTDGERNRFRAFLASEGYDTQLHDLVVNEMQAYLMHTSDVRYFNPAIVNIPVRRLDALRGLFLTGMPPGWLRDCTTAPALPR